MRSKFNGRKWSPNDCFGYPDLESAWQDRHFRSAGSIYADRADTFARQGRYMPTGPTLSLDICRQGRHFRSAGAAQVAFCSNFGPLRRHFRSARSVPRNFCACSTYISLGRGRSDRLWLEFVTCSTYVSFDKAGTNRLSDLFNVTSDPLSNV